MSITTNDFQTLTKHHGDIKSEIITMYFYVPDEIQIVADHDVPLIKQISPEEVTRIDEVESKFMVLSQSFDVNSLFPIKQASVRQFHQTNWHQIATMLICAVASLGVI